MGSKGAQTLTKKEIWRNHVQTYKNSKLCTEGDNERMERLKKEQQALGQIKQGSHIKQGLKALLFSTCRKSLMTFAKGNVLGTLERSRY